MLLITGFPLGSPYFRVLNFLALESRRFVYAGNFTNTKPAIHVFLASLDYQAQIEKDIAKNLPEKRIKKAIGKWKTKISNILHTLISK